MSQRFDSTVALASLLAVGLLAGCTSAPPRGADAAATKVGANDSAGSAASAGEPIPDALAKSYERAVGELSNGNYTEAELELKSLVLEFPDFAGPYVNLAIIYMHDGRQDDADAALARALKLDPDSAPANNELGILRRQQGRFAEAESAYEAAIAADPNYALAYLNLGVLLDLYLKRGAEALANYEHYQTLRGSDDETVAKWIIDLRRRVEAAGKTAQVAKDDAS